MTGRRSGERGQLLLIAAILLAVVVVGTVVLLNGVRFTEGAGSADALREAKQVDQTVADVRPSLRMLLVGVGTETGPFVENSTAGMDALRANVAAFSDTYGNLSGYGGGALVGVTLEADRTVNGTVAAQQSGRFENAAGSGDWTLAADLGGDPASELYALELNVTDQSDSVGSNFTLRYRSASRPAERVELEFTERTVYVDRPGASPHRLCNAALGDDPTEVRFIGGRIRLSGNNTESCDIVPLPGGSGSDYAVEIRNGGEANGSFVATVGQRATVPGDVPGRSTDAVVNPAVRVAYDSPTVQFDSSVRVMEGNVEP